MNPMQAELVAEIDTTWSWSADSLVPADTLELSVPAITPVSIPVRLPTLQTRASGFVFPDAARWLPQPDHAATIAGREKRKKQATGNRQKHNRIKPPQDIVKLHDRLYYLLQPPLDLLVGSGQLKFPFEPFPYQLDGITFLFPRYAGILADEMGLGKTMQAISTIRLLLCSGEVRNVLLVCPKPLVTNWLREFSVWAPEIPIAPIEGNAAKRDFQWRSPQVPVKVANYELLMRDEDIVLDSGLHFDLVVLDEAQRIKNRNSTTSQIVQKIPRTRAWALTGTPVENCPDDLVGIFEFLSPGYMRPGLPMPQIASQAKDYILRRTKDMVLDDMPPKLYRDANLDLTPQQWQTYEAAEKEGVVHLEELEQSLTIQHVFELVLRLKQICNFDPVTGSSCKLERLCADMEEVVASGKKAIVFSQWVKSLDKIRDALAPYGPLEYHGRIPQKKRNTVIDQFKNDPKSSVILMSYGAGSVGLNLQFCEYVFLFDRWWNPAVEDQAINRAHRLGAAGAVTVTRMMAMGTIEQRIADVLDQKREMFDALFSDNASPAKSGGLTREEIFGLFDLRAPSGKKVA
ncbi:DEAD/DEAH box helicase [Stieleria varia]|uniref:ATP-dependent helicase HepA n=1 Tax=Stieleria varia TaxID=2528005 RepID=A0A5C6ARR2_9BACT|nr:DEAD/DEAH box helicase [Stieleria varia]TWU02703.1 ATP-dependent helicase HepA [Stieleria varia]